MEMEGASSLMPGKDGNHELTMNWVDVLATHLAPWTAAVVTVSMHM